ncbi:hypothetical protein [Jeotgalibaca porci]|uniref:hypothetical protein n=1 Tax=Jeotgalibaca porci TaxID=1868793 RepID=UPI00359F78D6
MLFQNNLTFIEPPETFRGTLILESDDGRIGDYTHWLPLLKTKKQKSKWYPFRYGVSACTAVVTNFNGTSGYTTRTQLQALVDAGWEMMNHGMNHVGSLSYELIGSAKAGDVNIEVFLDSMGTAYDYIIRSNTTQNTEIIRPLTVNGKNIILTSPLKNDYEEGSFIELTPENLNTDINGSLDTLISWGFDVKHFVAPFHHVGPVSLAKIAERHLTARTTSVGDTNPLPITNKFRMNGALAGTFNDEKIKSFIDKIYTEDSVAIFYGHGELYGKGSTLDKLVDYAIEKNVRILTRNEAYLLKMV